MNIYLRIIYRRMLCRDAVIDSIKSSNNRYVIEGRLPKPADMQAVSEPQKYARFTIILGPKGKCLLLNTWVIA